MSEFKDKCDACKKKGPSIAQIYYEPIDDKWVFFCKSCWDAVEKFKKGK